MHRSRSNSCRPRFAGGFAVLVLAGCAPAEEDVSQATAAVSELPAPDDGFQDGIYLPFNDLVLGETDGVQVLANGNLAVSWAGSSFAGAIDENDQLETFEAGIGLRGAMTIELGVEGSGDVADTLQLATIPLPVFTVGASIEVSPYAQVRVHLTGSADAGARVSMVAPFRIGTAFSNSGVPDAELSSPPRFEPELGIPGLAEAVAFDGTVELEITLTFITTIEGIPIGGPVIATALGAALALDPAQAIWWDLDGLATVRGGWAFLDPVTLLPDVPEDLEELSRARRDIDEADAPLPGVETSTRWSQVFDVLRDDNATGILADGDELVVLEAGGQSWLAALDGLGAPVEQSTSIETLTATAMVHASDGDLVVAGADGAQVRFDRHDPSGEQQWTRTVAVPGASRVTCTAMVPTAENGLIFAGEVMHSGGIQQPIVAAIDEDGTVAWATELDMGLGSTAANLYGLALTPSGEIVAVGSVHYTDTPNYADSTIYGENALVVKLDAQGAPLSAFAAGGRGHEGADRIAMHPDGSYSIGGDDGSAPYVMWLATFAADDTLLWWGSYQVQPDVGAFRNYNNLTGLLPLDRKGLLVAGDTGSGTNMDAWILRVDAGGMPVWVKRYSSPDTDDLAGVVALPDGLAAAGTTGYTEAVTTYSDLWVIRTSVDGMVHFSDGNGFDAENTAMQWQIITGKTLHALAPEPLATTLEGDPAEPFATIPASAVGELLTD
jgi:hypothetical protein